MTDDLFPIERLYERLEILEKKVDEILKTTASDAEAAPSYACNYPSQEFIAFWEAYPRKQGMKPAWQAWRKCGNKPLIEEIIAAIKRQKKSEQWKKGIIPLPATWINQERFDDET